MLLVIEMEYIISEGRNLELNVVIIELELDIVDL